MMVPWRMARPSGRELNEADAAHEVFAIGHLWVHLAGGCQHDAGAQVAQVQSHCRRADVYRQAVRLFTVAGHYPDGLASLPHGHGELAVLRPHDLLQARQQHGIQPDPRQAEAGFQLGGDAVPIAQRVLQAGVFDLHVIEADGRVNDHRSLGGGLADDLLARLALFGDVHKESAVYLADA